MIRYFYIILLLFMMTSVSCQNENVNSKKNKYELKVKTMKFNKLTQEEQYVILNKGTERPYTGRYYEHEKKGTYNCKQCDAPLYMSDNKFDAHCGWPSFDDEIKDAVKRITDADGMRTEIVCANCGGHLGHVFIGEGFTEKNTRHCVNSISLTFTPLDLPSERDTAIFASGCFWGTEHWLKKQEGVISTEVGYIGGHVDNPTYEDVCSKKSGHAEAVRVVYNPKKVSFETLAKVFFETHDPTQANGQGPDIGNQYRSEIFFTNENQKKTAKELIKVLKNKGFKVVTNVTEATEFWLGEEYHQDYYTKKGQTPYCHFYTKRF